MYLLLIIVTLFILWIRKRRQDSLQNPPGPAALPFIGNLIPLRRLPHLQLAKWARKFGNVMTVYLGSYRLVVLSDATLIKKAFEDSKFSGRIHLDLIDYMFEGHYGISFQDGSHSIEQRKFTVRNLRQLGVGTGKMQLLVLHEINEFFKSLVQIEGISFNIAARFSPVVLNALWKIIAGKRYSHEDPMINELVHVLHEVDQKLIFSVPCFWPSLAQKFPKIFNWKFYADFITKFRKFTDFHINEHIENLPADGIPSDFLHSFLQEIEKTKDPNSSFHSRHGIKSIRGTLIDLIIAGSNTTSSVLAWLVLYLCKHPDVQKKLQAELDNVTGTGNEVNLTARAHLPYLEAIIQETMRIAPPLPMGLFHATKEDGHIAGYCIPRGTWVVANIYGMNHREDFWGDPDKFRPERFLNRKTSDKFDYVGPFSVGKRFCIGESVAKDTLFLVTANLYKRFTVKLANESSEVGFEHRGGFTIFPQEYNVIVNCR